MPIDDSATERIQVAERHLSLMRVAAVGAMGILFFFHFDDRADSAAAAYALLAAAGLYSLFVLLFEPGKRFSAFATSYATTLADGTLIAAWLFVTGGAASSFYPLWYISLVAVAYRFDHRRTLWAAAAYALLYIAAAALTGTLLTHGALLTLQLVFLGFVAVVAALMARESHAQILARQEMGEEMLAARTAEAKFRGLLEAAPDPIVIVDRSGRMVLVNSQAERVFGYSREELLGAPVETLMPQQVRHGHHAHREGYFDKPQARPMGVDLELRGRRKDGTEFPVEISLSPMETEEGTLVTSIIHDISERKRAEEERLTSLERLKELERLRELDKFKTTFINTAAHELGTPLTPIKLQLHILKTSGDGALSARQRKAVEILDRNVDRLNHLVQEVLKVARLQAGRLGVTKERVDLNRIVFEAVESFQEPARESRIQLELRTTPGLQIDADPKRLTQVLFNLLNNAWKFTPDGGRITIETARLNDMAVVRVRDTGQGMKPDDIHRLFQPFSQVHDTMQKTHAGTGLGLYICKGILDLHRGRIWAESPGPGLGSTFSFAVPVDAPASAPTLPSAEEKPIEPTQQRADTIAKRARELI